MGVSWTTEQQKVIDLRKRNILVSAAAGSGKTAVLVERIKSMICDGDNPVDIDRLLIVTFTNAAAAEMRERIGDAIEKALADDPLNEHLLRQTTLLHNAQITTIDSFCLYVIRNHFNEIDLEPSFRVADEGELKLMREDVFNELMEARYEEKDPDFLSLADGYASGRTDVSLGDMVMRLYNFSMSYPWPKEWLMSCVKDYEINDDGALDDAVWMKRLTQNIKAVLSDLSDELNDAADTAAHDDDLSFLADVLTSDSEKYAAAASCGTFEELYLAVTGITYDRMPSSRGYKGDPDELTRLKNVRESAKKQIKKLQTQYFWTSPKEMAKVLNATAKYANGLVGLTIDFMDAFAAEKRRRNVVDFSDMEHFALEILVDEDTRLPKRAAEEFRDTFEEIMIDEYQDSNQVQETILRAISREDRGSNNIFMVGDVKQSIYRFRLARPELFMEKFDTYSMEDSDRQRVDLYRNFRSRSEVLSFSNDIFYRIMGRDLGNVSYDEKVALYPGASFPQSEDCGMFKPEVIFADSDDDLLEDTDYKDKKILEAKLVANRIKEMMDTQLVTDKKTGELRRVRYSDIVILLRSITGWADRFAQILGMSGIPAYTLSQSGYFSAIEVQTVLSFLKILDNPMQDIPMAAVLRSPIVELSDEELAAVRLIREGVPFYECVLDAFSDDDDVLDVELRKKLKRFSEMFLRLRELVPETPVHELIEIILKETGYGEYAAAMPAGDRRYANLMMLVQKAIDYEKTSYKGLFHFVRYIDELQKYDVDFGEADMTGENEDVVRIMSIHKSKGLEFPVVFVSGLGKLFNKMDMRSRMVLHPEYGIGLDYIDGKRRVKTQTIAKRAIAKLTDLENMGEELRILYVALTRAKEKLILTGTSKGVLDRLNEPVQINSKTKLIPYLVRESAAGYLGWIIPALATMEDKDSFVLKISDAEELVKEEVEAQVTDMLDRAAALDMIEHADSDLVKKIDETFSYRYPFSPRADRKNKYSVSELKHRAMEEHLTGGAEDGEMVYSKTDETSYIPSFAAASPEAVNKGALKGTALHRVMECYDFASDETVRGEIDRMTAENKLSREMAELVFIPSVEKFIASDAASRMKEAARTGRLYREKAFVMGFTDEELEAYGYAEPLGDGTKDDELTLIQGIIDVFWMEDDGIVLLDYKSDNVKSADELVKKYEAQLRLYADALGRIYSGLTVKEIIIYSFKLGEMINIRI